MSFGRGFQPWLRALWALAAVGACGSIASAFGTTEWRPSPIHPVQTSLADVLAMNAKAAGSAKARYAQRRERWTYTNGDKRLDVQVSVRDDDYRATIALGNAVYEAGRANGAGWRADANGATHLTFSEDQGDALDRLPRALFPIDRTTLTLAGETGGASSAWVIAGRPARDKPRWFFVDRTTGLVVREIVREGGRTIVTTFDHFERIEDVLRPQRWHVRDGDARNDIDAQVESVVPETVDESAVAIPRAQRFFGPRERPMKRVTTLPAHFVDGDRILIDVELDGHKMQMVLDTGTASITLDSSVARKYGWQRVLEHATVPRITVGGFTLANASVLTIPLGGVGLDGGILGLDFFSGHVVHIDYEHHRVEILDRQTADAIFADPAVTVLAADVSEGLPLVHASFGRATGDRFAIDTGSSNLFVLDAFTRRWPAEVARWSATTFYRNVSVQDPVYLEGSIRVAARRVSGFEFGPLRFTQETVGVEEPSTRSDAITIPLDGIIGTDHLSRFDLWFDYDQERMALRRNNLR